MSEQGKLPISSKQLYFCVVWRSVLFLCILLLAFYLGYLAAAFFPEIWYLQPLVWLFVLTSCVAFYQLSISLEQMAMKLNEAARVKKR